MNEATLEMVIRTREQLSGMDVTIRKIKEMKRQFGAMVSAIATHARKLIAWVNEMRMALVRLHNAFRTLRNVALRAFTAIVSFTGIAIGKFFGDFEQGMANVNTLLDVSEKKFQQMSDEVIRISNQMGESAQSLSTALYDIVSAGVSAGNSLGVLEQAAMAAKAGMTTTKTAVNAGIATINAFNLSVKDLTKVFNLQFSTVKRGVITYEQLAEAQGQMLPSARKLNESLENMYGALAFVTKQGLSAREATTAIARAYDELVAKSDQLAEKGIKVYDQFGKFRGIVDIMQDLSDAVEGLTDEQMQGVLQDIGFEIRSARAIIPMIKNIEGLKDIVDEMGDSSGAMAEAFRKATDTVQFHANRAKTNVVNAFIGIGGAFTEEIKDFMDSISAWAGTFQTFIKNNKEAIKSLLSYTLRLTGIITAIAAVGTAIFALATPIGAVTAAIGILGAAWYLNVYDIRGWTEDMWNKVQPILENMWQWLGKAWNWTINAIGNAWDWLTNTTWKEKWDDIKSWMQAGWEWVINLAGDAWNWLDEKAPWIGNTLETVWNWTINGLEKLSNLQITEAVIHATLEWFGETYQAIKKGFETGDWSDAIGVAADIFRAGVVIMTTLKVAKDSIAAVKAAISAGLGIMNAFGSNVFNQIGGAAGLFGIISIGVALAEAWSQNDYEEFANNLLLALAAGLAAYGVTGSVTAGATVFTLTFNLKIGEVIGNKLEEWAGNALDKALEAKAANNTWFWKFMNWLDESVANNDIPVWKPPGFATGGYVSGAGTSTSDSIPAMLSNGEFVVNARATRRWLPFLKAINEGDVPGFSDGGYVSTNQATLIAAGLADNQALAYLATIAQDTENFKHVVSLIAGFKDMRNQYEEQMKKLQEQQAELQEQLKNDIEELKENQEEQTKQYTASIEQMIGQMAGFFNQLGSITGSEEAGLLGSLISAGQQGYSAFNNFKNATGLVSQLTAGFGIAGAALTAIGAFKSYNEARNREERQEWQEQMEVDKQQLENIKKIRDNTAETAKNMVQVLAQNPTMSNIGRTQSVMRDMYQSLTNTLVPEFGKVAFHVVEEDLLFDDEKTVKYNPIDLMKKMGKDVSGFSSDISSMSLSQLSKLNDMVQSVTSSDLEGVAQDIADTMDLFGSGELKSYTTNWDTFKNKLQNYLDTVKELGAALEDLAKSARYESFAGVQWVDAQERVEQYRKQLEELYKAAGKDLDKHKGEIDKAVKEYANNIVDGGERIITIMRDVRGSFINAFASGKSALESMATGLQPYFQTLKNNIASLFYDIEIDRLDAQFKELFGNIIDALASYEGHNPLQFVEELLQGGDMQKVFDSMINMAQNMDDISGINDIIIEQFTKQAKAAGLTDEEIKKLLESMGLLTTEAQQAKESLQATSNALKNAMYAALESESITDFSQAMGKSIYESARDGLIQAFMESEVYQEMFSKWFEGQDINFTGNLEEDFATMQGMLDSLKDQLHKAGMDFESTVVPTAQQAADELYGSSSYYTDKEGAEIIENHYHFEPKIENLYGDDKESLYKDFVKWLKDKEGDEA